MATSLFEIVVSHDRVEASLSEPGVAPIETPAADLLQDQLATDTVEVMDRWLNFWRLINASNIRHPETLFERATTCLSGRPDRSAADALRPSRRERRPPDGHHRGERPTPGTCAGGAPG